MPRPRSLSDDEILDGVLRVLAREGPSRFTLAAAAAETGLAPPTLLQRFGAKQGLLKAALRRADAALDARLRDAVAAGCAGSDAVVALLGEMAEGFGSGESLADQLTLLREDFQDPETNAAARARSAALREALAAMLPPAALPPAEMARLVEAQWHGAVVQWGFLREGELRAYVERALRGFMVAAGLGAEGASSGPAEPGGVRAALRR